MGWKAQGKEGLQAQGGWEKLLTGRKGLKRQPDNGG
jgi:hypothetical protein